MNGTSIGRGFAGNQKRHNFGRGPMSHGSKIAPPVHWCWYYPGRVYPGKRMAGRLWRVTIRKLTVVR